MGRLGGGAYVEVNQGAFLACLHFRGFRRGLYESRFFGEKLSSCAGAENANKRASDLNISPTTGPGYPTSLSVAEAGT